MLPLSEHSRNTVHSQEARGRGSGPLLPERIPLALLIGPSFAPPGQPPWATAPLGYPGGLGSLPRGATRCPGASSTFATPLGGGRSAVRKRVFGGFKNRAPAFYERPRPIEAALRWASGRPTSPSVLRTRSKRLDTHD